MNRIVLLAAALLLVMPSTVAHEGGGLYPLQIGSGTIKTEDPVHNFPLVPPLGLQEPGQVLAFGITNAGPADITLFLLGDDNSTVESWPVPGNGAANVFLHHLATPQNLTLRLQNDGQMEADVAFMYDAEAGCNYSLQWFCTKRLAFDETGIASSGSVMVAPMEVEAAGTYRTTASRNDVHDLRLTIWDPTLETQIISSDQTNSQGEIVVSWNAPTPGTYHFVLVSEAVNRAPYDNAPSGGAAYEELRVTVLSEGPFSQGAPAPGVMPVLLVLVGLALRRRVTG